MESKFLESEKDSKCNICEKQVSLSWDHVPPKGAIRNKSVELKFLVDVLSNPNKVNYTLSQNGLKFRTICSECNSLMGTKYDIEYIKLISKLTSSLQDPTKPLEAYVNIELITKSIVGHLLAAKNIMDNSAFDTQLREYFLTDKKFPFKLYYWFYPYEKTMVARDVLIFESIKKLSIVSYIKCFPIAFLITDTDFFDEELSQFNYDGPIVSNSKIVLSKKNVLSQIYPLFTSNKSFIVGGQSLSEAIISNPRQNKN